MLSLLLRRLRAQRRLLLGVVALMTVGSTLLGLGSLLLSVSEEQALRSEVRRLPPEGLDVTAYLARVANADARGVSRDATRVVVSALSPFDSTVTTGAVSVMRRLGDDRFGYLASSDDLRGQASLTSGRWPGAHVPDGVLEAAVPDTTARALGLALGSRVSLGREIDEQFVERPVTVVVVGTFRSRSRAAWQQDPLSGAGFDPAYSNGAVSAPAYGPFEVDADALVASGSSFASLRVTARPRLDAVTGPTLEKVADDMAAADPRLSAAVDGRVEIERVASDLPATLERVRLQQAASRATVLVAVLLGTALSVAALLLAGRSVAMVRAEEQALLVGLGAGRRQLLALSLGEGAVLAACSAALAIPLSALLHAWLTHLPGLSEAGLAHAPSVTWTQVQAILLGCVLLTGALVGSALRAEQSAVTKESAPVVRAARSGLDVLLLALAVASWWQLRSQPAGAATSGDAVQILAPVLCVVATAVVAVRLLPPLFDLVARSVHRSRTLLLPLAVVEAARRPASATASVLLVAAMASATFGLCLSATWHRSQEDQAALRVGTDLSVALPTSPTSGQAAAVARAAGGVLSPVTARPVALGRYVGDAGSAPTLVATDARRAGELWRGRAPAGTTWAELGRSIAPAHQVVGLSTSGAGAELQGAVTTPGGDATSMAITVVPTMVVQGAGGLRSTVTAGAVPLDGRTHPVRWSFPVPEGQHLVALQLVLSTPPLAEVEDPTGAPSDLEVTLRLPGDADARDEDRETSWSATSLGQSPTPATSPTVRVRSGAGASLVVATAKLSLTDLQYVGARLVATAFTAPSAMPVLVSHTLARSVGVKTGGVLAVSVDGVSVPARVAGVVPTVPSAPSRIAVLADQDMLSRVLISAGQLEPTADAWWVGSPGPDAAARVRALGLGDVLVRREIADHLTAGPLGVMVPTVLLVLVIAAMALAVAGTGVRLSADLGTRAAEIARLRALGLSRRMVTQLLIGQHGTVLTMLVLLGAALGAAASFALATLLVRSDAGLAPVPDAQLVWPWVAELAVVGALVLASLAMAAVLAVVHVRRSDVTLLRSGGGG